jgi:hypothetical protein
MSGQNNMLNHLGYYSNRLEKGFSILRGLPPPYDPPTPVIKNQNCKYVNEGHMYFIT